MEGGVGWGVAAAGLTVQTASERGEGFWGVLEDHGDESQVDGGE